MTNSKFVKVFVTGGAGFVGSFLAESLLNKGNNVTVFDDFSNSTQEKASLLANKGATVIKGDIRNFEFLKKHLIGFDTVIHLAAKIDVPESTKKPELYHKVNVLGTKNLLNVCEKKGIKNVIAASSAAVFGKPNKLPLSDDSLLSPESPYGQTKVEMEKLLADFSKNYDLNSISLRFFNVYGKGQTDAYAGVITKFMNKIKENKPLLIFGDGSNTRDFISVNDVAESIMSAIEHIEGKQGNCYNIATGKHVTINELAQLMINISGKPLEIKHDPPLEGDILHSQTKIDLAKQELNFTPKVKLEDGLKALLVEN